MYCPFISSKDCGKSCFSKTLHETAGEDNPEKQFVFIDGGTTNLGAAGIIPERLSATTTTQYPAMPAAQLYAAGQDGSSGLRSPHRRGLLLGRQGASKYCRVVIAEREISFLKELLRNQAVD